MRGEEERGKREEIREKGGGKEGKENGDNRLSAFFSLKFSVELCVQEIDNVKRLQEEMRRTVLDANNQIASVFALP